MRTLFLLFLGQVLSFGMAMMSFTASLVAAEGVDAPLTLSFFSYLALTLVYGSIMLYRSKKLLVPWYWYVLLGFVDVHGNYLVNKAYEFSSITSVTILDCWTIAWVILLTWIFLGTKYSWWQFFGAAICLAGLGLVLLSDAHEGGEGGSKPLLGDVLVVAGTIFFALSNVGEEFCVKKKDRVEVVAMIGLFGMLLSAIEIVVLERKILESVTWSSEIMTAFAGYAASSFMFYTLVPFVLKMGGSTLFNLSLLTSNMWAVAIIIFFYKQKVDWLYFLAFAVVVVGIAIYSKTSKKDHESIPTIQDADHNPAYLLLDEENSDTRNDAAVSSIAFY
ncbi:solute carrier family 35 member F2-like isoform X1 [Olea europaea var. sylvestris]|uniref:solute carrier family 35 member F2-like isoform X1 n=2 Tax=Olea europaea var. sylvestris TaxID=158386 RepID=UPI000C1D150A|nr:solute carrier family 35 member F2-like isoform X1 [Olea europaea var. sylvestris]